MKILSNITRETIFESKHTTIARTVLAAIKAGINLSKVDLYGADLSKTNLSETDFSRADLSETNLSGANLSGAHLYRAKLYGADLSETNLSGTDLSGANLYRANGIISIQFFGFNIYIQKNNIKIGCKYMSITEWHKVTVDKAMKMGIKKEHYELYKILCKAGICVLN